MGIYLTGTEFRKLWRQFDTSGDGKINYAEFNNKVGYMILPFAAGLEMKRPDTPKMRDWQVKAMAKTIQKKIKDIEVAFKEIDTDGSGKISHAEFIQALRKLGLGKVGDSESAQMMDKYKSHGNNTGEMLFSEFKACIEDYLRIPGSEADGGGPKEKSSASLQIAEKTLSEKLPKSAAAIEALFAPFDEYKNGEISYESFKKGLAAGGIVLSKAQFDSICYKLDAIDDGIIAYKDFALSQTGGEVRKEGSSIGVFEGWARNGIKTILDLVTGKPYSVETACNHASAKLGLSINEGRLVFALLGRRAEWKASCAQLDPEGSGTLPKDKVQYLLDKYSAPISDDMLSTLFQKYDRTRSGRMNYIELDRWLGLLIEPTDANLKRFNLERMTPSELASYRVSIGLNKDGSVPGKASTAAETGALRVGGGGAGAAPRPTGRPRDDSDIKSIATESLDMSNAYRKLTRTLGKKWVQVAMEVQRRAAHDTTHHGGETGRGSLVPASVLRDALADHGVALTSKEVRGLSHHYHGKGIKATRHQDGHIDLEAIKEIFAGHGKGVAGSLSSARSSSVPPSQRR